MHPAARDSDTEVLRVSGQIQAATTCHSSHELSELANSVSLNLRQMRKWGSRCSQPEEPAFLNKDRYVSRGVGFCSPGRHEPRSG
jgi:hypothetical protein